MAGLSLSRNADGVEGHAAASVDMEWEDHLDAADTVLRAIREPDAAIAEIGSPDLWETMVAAALAASTK